MKKTNRYFLICSIELLLYLIFIIGLTAIYKRIVIPQFFSYEFFVIPVIAIALIISIVFFIVTFALLIVNYRKYKINKSSNFTTKSAIVLPLLFLIVVNISWIVPLSITKTEIYSPTQHIISNSNLEKLENEGIDVDSECVSQSNFFGKIANWDLMCIVSDETADLSYSCYYRQSHNSNIFNKFWRLESNCFENYKKITTDDYTVYYEDKGTEIINFVLEINKDDIYFLSEYYTYGDIAICDYSIEMFIEDSLRNYETICNQGAAR